MMAANALGPVPAAVAHCCPSAVLAAVPVSYQHAAVSVAAVAAAGLATEVSVHQFGHGQEVQLHLRQVQIG